VAPVTARMKGAWSAELVARCNGLCCLARMLGERLLPPLRPLVPLLLRLLERLRLLLPLLLPLLLLPLLRSPPCPRLWSQADPAGGSMVVLLGAAAR